MKKIVKLFGIASLFLALLTIALSGCAAEENNGPPANAPTAPTPPAELETVERAPEEVEAEEGRPEAESPEAEAPELPEMGYGPPGVTWLVPPTLEHSRVFHCAYCDFFALDDHSGRLIDRETGQLAGDNPFGGHGLSGGAVYDPERNVFGFLDFGATVLFPFDELLDHAPWATTAFMVVEQVDSSILEQEDDREWLGPGAFTGRYAVMTNGRFVTDFHFDAHNPLSGGRNMMPLSRGGNWGIVNQNGETVVPFVFERIVNDSNIAFARYNGKYGIIDIRSMG